MNTQAERKSHCKAAGCAFVYNCKVFWGSECRNQGGTRIPRMKKMPIQFFDEPEMQEASGSKKAKIGQVFEKIRTRVVGW